MIDGGVTSVNNQHGGAVTLCDSGIFAPNTLTFSGSEALGGGTKAIFNLPSQFDLGSGATILGANQMFNRTAYVGLSDERLGSFGVLYGLGGVAGSFSVNSTISAGMNYDSGPLGIGVAYIEAKYPELSDGQEAIRNFGAGVHYRFGSVLVMLLYTNTRNTASGAKIDVYEAGTYWTLSTA